MKKNLLIAAILGLSSFAVMAQTAATTGDITQPVHKVKKHPIKSRLHKINAKLKANTSPPAPTAPKP